MSLKRRLVRSFDHPGLRGLLAAVTTRYARWLTKSDVEVMYDGLWVHRAGPLHFPDGPQFRYFREEMLQWSVQAERYISDAHDYWYHINPVLPGEVVVDVGAGRGEDVLAFSASVGPAGRVVAIEAHPRSFALLKKFCELNRLTNVRPIQVATMDRAGFVTMGDGDHWEGNAIGGDAHRVPATTLDEICRSEAPGAIGLLKMNIEGAESLALPGAIEVLARTRLVVVACHDFRADRGEGEQYRTRDFVQHFLGSRGFELTFRPDDSREYVRDHVFGVRR